MKKGIVAAIFLCVLWQIWPLMQAEPKNELDCKQNNFRAMKPAAIKRMVSFACHWAFGDPGPQMPGTNYFDELDFITLDERGNRIFTKKIKNVAMCVVRKSSELSSNDAAQRAISECATANMSR